MKYNIHYDVAAAVLTIIAIIVVLLKKDMKKKQSSIMIIMFGVILLSCIFDIGSVVVGEVPQKYSLGIKQFWNYGYLLLQNIQTPIFTWFISVITGVDFSKRNKKGFNISLWLPSLFIVVMFAINPFTDLLFYFEDGLYYTHGKLMYVLYVIAMLYLMINIVLILKYGKKLALVRRLLAGGFMAVTIIIIIVQMHFPYILMTLFATTISMFTFMLSLDNTEELLDSTTHCYNRKSFIYDMRIFFDSKAHFDIILIKIKNLNYYNTTLGIFAMEDFLKQIGTFLNNLDSTQQVYYCNNGAFAIMVETEDKLVGEISSIRSRLSQAFYSSGYEIRFKADVYSVNVPKDTNNIDSLLLAVDVVDDNNCEENINARYNGHTVFSYKREIAIENAIIRAQKNRGFEVYYQPIIDSVSNKVVAAEALLRLHDDELGNVSPNEFIPIAEKKGYITDIGYFVLEEVCRVYKELDLASLGIKYVEVNLSPVQCMATNCVENFCGIVKKYGLENKNIVFEITESAMAQSEAMLEDFLDKLVEKGFVFSVDDFGTGYSNYSYVFNMPMKIVKIDKSILWNAVKNEKARIVMKNSAAMIHELDMKIVVEGVESKEQKELSVDLGADFLQGYYYSMAIPEKEFVKYLRSYSWNQ